MLDFSKLCKICMMEVNLEGKVNFYCSMSVDNLMYIYFKGKKICMDFIIGV